MQSQINLNPCTHILVMGVSGCGKTTIAKRLSSYFDLPFLEGDDFHPAENIEKMSSGIALTDEDRIPWLERLNAACLQFPKGAVLACSALKESYRMMLHQSISEMIVVFLEGDFDIIHQRIQERTGHFMPAHLLQSQFEALELPKEGIYISIDQSLEDMEQEIIQKINDRQQ